MYNPDTEILFPERVIPVLRSLRTKEWESLIDAVCDTNRNGIDRSAFVLMMVRLCGCTGCNADSFRAMRGCTQCARQAVRRFRGSDAEMLQLYQQSKSDVLNYTSKRSAESD